MNYPASWWAAKWREAIPLGNGSIGASVYGAVYDETILINHEDLWMNCTNQKLPDVSDNLPLVRKYLLSNQVEKAENVIGDALKEQGYRHTTAAPLPLGDFKIVMPVNSGFRDYSRVLDMEKGEAVVRWRDNDINFERRTFVSRAEDVIAIKISSSSKNIIADIYLDMHEADDAHKPFGVKSAPLPKDAETKIENNYIFYSAKNDDGMDFGAVAKVIAPKGDAECIESRMKLSDAECITVLIKVFVKGKRKAEWQKLQRELSELNESYEDMMEAHYKIHGEIFNSASFSLSVDEEDCALSNEQLLLDAYKGEAPDVLVEKLWSYGRYLLIASSREGGQPCPLLGLWAGEYDAMFSFNMANENIQMIYWQALTGNIPDVLLAMFDYYESMMDDFRINAKHLYGCRGIFIPAVSTPGEGLIQHLGAHIVHWTGAAGWLSQHYYDYYLFTNDEEFLKKRAIPFMKEAALFYKDFFILNDDGFYISAPSNSPENTPSNLRRKEDKNTITSFSTTVNATMDFAIAKELLTNLIEGAQIIGSMEADINEWREMLSFIPPYEINEEGAIKEWMHPDFKDNYHHRHQSHAYPVFPGYEMTEEENPELFEAFVTAIKKRLVVGLTSQTSWSLAHMACNYARMGEGDLALECLDNISRSGMMNNFFTVHNDWRSMGIGSNMSMAPFQIDANMGWTGAVQEMLLFSKPGFLKVLPAVPKKWIKGEIAGLLARGSIEVSIRWDMQKFTIELELRSNKKQKININLPIDIKSLVVNDVKSSHYSKNIIKGFDLAQSEIYKIHILADNTNQV